MLPPPRGLGCFAKGCLAVAIVGIVLVIICSIGGWFILSRLLAEFTSREPARIEVQQPVPAEFQAAETKLQTLRTAIRNNQQTTVAFSAADLNALIANDPDFRSLHDHVRVAISNSIISLDVSAPLDSLRWMGLHDRWFNGNVRFGMSYADDDFTFDLKSAEANGRRMPNFLFSSDFEQSFGRSFKERLRSGIHPDSDDSLAHIKTMSVQDDTVTLTTRTM